MGRGAQLRPEGPGAPARPRPMCRHVPTHSLVSASCLMLLRAHAQPRMHGLLNKWMPKKEHFRERLLQARAKADEICTLSPPALGKWPQIDELVAAEFVLRRSMGDPVRSGSAVWGSPRRAPLRYDGWRTAGLALVGPNEGARNREDLAERPDGGVHGEPHLVPSTLRAAAMGAAPAVQWSPYPNMGESVHVVTPPPLTRGLNMLAALTVVNANHSEVP